MMEWSQGWESEVGFAGLDLRGNEWARGSQIRGRQQRRPGIQRLVFLPFQQEQQHLISFKRKNNFEYRQIFKQCHVKSVKKLQIHHTTHHTAPLGSNQSNGGVPLPPNFPPPLPLPPSPSP